MTCYIKISTMQYPLHEGDIRLEYPDIDKSLTGDQFPCPDTYVLVHDVDLPDWDKETHKCVEVQPVKSGDVWYRSYVIEPYTDEELLLMQQTEQDMLDMSGTAPDVVE